VLAVSPAYNVDMQNLLKNLQFWLLAALLVANMFIWYAIWTEENGGVLTVAFLDVGQGDAIFIEAPNGNQLLIDGGPTKGVLTELSKLMPLYDRSIDVVIATHPDKDHIGGLIEVLERYEVDVVLRSGAENDTGVYHVLNGSIEREDALEILARRGQRLVLDDGVFLDILFPDRDVTDFDPNDASVVARLVYGETTFLFTGDAPKSIEEYLASLGDDAVESDVLKVGHHGSKTSSSEYFLAAVLPQIAVISAEQDSRYGHPHAEVLEALEAYKAEVVETSKLGTIVFTSDGKRLLHR